MQRRPSKVNSGAVASDSGKAVRRRSSWALTRSAIRGPLWHEAALAELAASHHQQVAISVNIAQAEAADLSCAQTEPIAETEDGTVGGTALPGSRVIRQTGGRY